MKNKIISNKINNFVKTICVLFLFVIISAANNCSSKSNQDEYITIGALLPLTGEGSDEGMRALNGLQLAKEEINESGGVLGKKLDIIVLNDRGDEEYAVQQYSILKEKGVIAIIGSSYSDVTLAFVKAAEEDGIPIISPSATSPDVTIGRKNVFRAIFIDDYQTEVMAYFAYNSLNARTALVLSNKSLNSYFRAAKIFAETFKKYGGLVRAVEPYSTDDDFAGILGKYAANPPDVIFCPSDYIPAAKLLKAVHRLGFRNTSMLGSDAWDGILAYVNNPILMKNVYYSAPFSPDDRDENVMLFVRKYFDNYLQMPLSGSATAYTCVYILSEAIKKAGNTNKDDIVSAIKTNELDLITGHIKFDENNNPRTNVYVIQIKASEYSSYEKLSL